MINKNDLISIIVKPTNACNLRCKHCYHAGTGYDNEQMSDKMLEKLILFRNLKKKDAAFMIPHHFCRHTWDIPILLPLQNTSLMTI